MLRRLSLLIVAIMCFFPNTARSLETVRVVVLPFKVHAVKDLSYMKAEISEVIKRHLKEEGAVVLDPESALDFTWEKNAESIDGIRNFGVQNGVDYVVCGSLTWIGEKFRLDGQVVESFGEGLPNVIIKEGQDIENLLGTVKQFARDIGMILFKREKVARVLITGNKRIEADAIKRVIKTEPGDVYLAKSLSEDLKAVYSMGYFENIRIEAEKAPEGKVIIFRVQEKPTIRNIRFKGNIVYSDEELTEKIDIRTGSILNIFKVRSNIKLIEELFKEKKYHNAKVTYIISQLENNQADLEFVIEEGEKFRIRSILFKGNSAYDDKKLKKIMKTSVKGFFSWLTSSGDLNLANLDLDVAMITAFYHNNGYIESRVGEPKIEYQKNWIDITIKIDEGPRFKVGKVDITGDLILPREKLLENVKISGETYFNREIVRNDLLGLTDLYSDEGYAYTDTSPRIDKDLDKLIVNITYVVDKRKQVYFENIFISGNKKTRDKVIRRELKVFEQELYSGKGLKRGVRNLYRLDYFEDVKVNTPRGSSDDKMILKIDVTEKPTGMFSFGGGYSSVEHLFVMASVSQRNLFGRGQVLQLKGEWGGQTNRYNLSFTEPWLFDIPLSAGFDLFSWETDYDTYDKESQGGGVRFGYTIYDYTRAHIRFAYDVSDLKNYVEVETGSGEKIYPDVPDSIEELLQEVGPKYTTKSISTTLSYDSRDRMFNPTEGSDHRITLEYAGFGGDIAFTKYLAETGWFIPLVKDTVGFLHGKVGYVKENPDGILPDYERFYLGGINSIRGFDWHGIHLLEEVTGPGSELGDKEFIEIGGEKFVQFNVEYLVSLSKKAGLVGLIFFDTGNVFEKDDNIDLSDLRKSVGYGFRWYSPIGPIRLECGYIIDPRPGEPTGGQWEFTMGTAF
jgi:outer membrane protein insertion porin family